MSAVEFTLTYTEVFVALMLLGMVFCLTFVYCSVSALHWWLDRRQTKQSESEAHPEIHLSITADVDQFREAIHEALAEASKASARMGHWS